MILEEILRALTIILSQQSGFVNHYPSKEISLNPQLQFGHLNMVTSIILSLISTGGNYKVFNELACEQTLCKVSCERIIGDPLAARFARL